MAPHGMNALANTVPPSTPWPRCCRPTTRGPALIDRLRTSRSTTPRCGDRGRSTGRGELRRAGLGAGRPDRDRAPQRSRDGTGAAGRDVRRLRGAAEPEVPRGRVPLLPRRPPRRGARRPTVRRPPPSRPRRERTIAIDVRSGDGLSIDLAGRRVEPADASAAGDRTPTTRRWCCTRRARRRDRRSCRCVSATWPARRATSPLRCELTAADRSLDGDAAVPHPRDHGRPAGAAVGRRFRRRAPPGFDAFKFHRWLDDLQPTYYTAVPTMHQMVLARCPATAADDAALRPIVVGVAARGRCSTGCRDLFDVPVIEAYGMTEASHQMTCNPLPPGVGEAGLGRRRRPASRWRSSTRTSNELPPGERGEVSIRGATVVDGYENNPTANEAAFTAGWFRTGDEGMLDDDGYLFLTGRLKEQINRGGEKISPLEIDEVAAPSPGDRRGGHVRHPPRQARRGGRRRRRARRRPRRHRARTADVPRATSSPRSRCPNRSCSSPRSPRARPARSNASASPTDSPSDHDPAFDQSVHGLRP